MKTLAVSSLLLIAVLTGPAVAAEPTPKEIVTSFFQMAFVDRKPTEAAMQFLSDKKYIQHRPSGQDTRDYFIKNFGAYVSKTAYKCEMKRAIAEGDTVAIHSHCKANPADPNDRGNAVADFYRVEDGKIVEHWDVEQPVPEKSSNTNTMF